MRVGGRFSARPWSIQRVKRESLPVVGVSRAAKSPTRAASPVISGQAGGLRGVDPLLPVVCELVRVGGQVAGEPRRPGGIPHPPLTAYPRSSTLTPKGDPVIVVAVSPV